MRDSGGGGAVGRDIDVTGRIRDGGGDRLALDCTILNMYTLNLKLF